jgi:hypothetical protein
VADPYWIEFLRSRQATPEDGEAEWVAQQEQSFFNREGHKKYATAWMIFHYGLVRFGTLMPRGYKDATYLGATDHWSLI